MTHESICIAVCGGPYSNPYALSAFVEDARRRGCVRLYCLGDLGGFGAEVDRIWPELLTHSITCVAGNYDVAISRGDPDCGCGYRDPRDNEFAQLIYDYTRNHTSPEFAKWMGQLPTERRENLIGHDVHFVHGSPLALNDFWWESLSDEEHLERVSASGADVICCTHSGLPWQRQVGSTLVVNVGVIGKPANDGDKKVWYGILEFSAGRVEAQLIALNYDWKAQAGSMRDSGIPEPFVETIESGWWTTCLEVLPPAERARGKFHLYSSSLPHSFESVGGTWGEPDLVEDDDDKLSVVPLFGTLYFPRRLWIYTNFHCNLKCDYCAVGSSPQAKRRLMQSGRFRELIDEAVSEGFTEIYLTGGEPLLHPNICEFLDYATDQIPTVVLTNAILLKGSRLERFAPLAQKQRLVVQTSLDGVRPDTHDLHRGKGSWIRTKEGIHHFVQLGFEVRVAMTETPENTHEIEEVSQLLGVIGIKPENFMVRPLLRRGFSDDGLEIGSENTIPELTVTQDGVYWHPAGADAESSTDMLLASGEVSLSKAKQLVIERFFMARLRDGSLPRVYRCAV